MGEGLTHAEIEARFEREWVLLEAPEVDGNEDVVRGKVIWHSKDRDEVYRKLLELNPRSAATLYTGKLRRDEAIVL